VVNGTAALQVALNLVGVKPGEEVLTQALTFVATANAIHHSHAEPIFIDVDIDTMGLSPSALRNFLMSYGELREDGTYNIKSGKRIAACMPMHTFGFFCRIEEIVEICAEYNIPVVEDAAEALGSFKEGKAAGTFGQIGAYSFNGNKIITAGGGGALISQNEALMHKAKHVTTTAKRPHAWEYVHDEYGYNFRMPNLNAALVCAQLEKIGHYLEKKKELYEAYSNELFSEGYKVKTIPEGTTEWNYWLQAIELENKEERDAFLRESNESGVMTRPIWQLMYRLPMYAHCQRDAQQNAEFLEERIVNIPSSAR
jgi:aminotransferase in exopolysaccharide biosynthesis